MRVFSQINKCQQLKKKGGEGGGAPLLGLPKSIYYVLQCRLKNVGLTFADEACIIVLF